MTGRHSQHRNLRYLGMKRLEAATAAADEVVEDAKEAYAAKLRLAMQAADAKEKEEAAEAERSRQKIAVDEEEEAASDRVAADERKRTQAAFTEQLARGEAAEAIRKEAIEEEERQPELAP